LPVHGLYLRAKKAAEYIRAHGLPPFDVQMAVTSKDVNIRGTFYTPLEALQLEIIKRKKRPLNPWFVMSETQRINHKELKPKC